MAYKTVLVTGASRGIGRAIALRFAEEQQYNIVINCSRSEEELCKVKEEAESYGSSCLALMGDMGDHDCCLRVFDRIAEKFGDVNILINNAGISYTGLLQDMSYEDWDRIIRNNLTSVFNCCKLAIPGMISRKEGRIINISSVWGNTGASCETAYSASKGGVNAFTKALAKELAPSNIQVNAIAPGLIDTKMNSNLDDEDIKALIEENPSGRIGTPEDVAELVYLLCSGNSYLTGQVITLDGGWT